MASHWNRVRHIVAEARELVSPARERFVDRACAGDAGLRHEVDSLLRGVHDADRFLEDLAARSGIPFADSDDEPPPGLGHVGSYRLLRRIGEGGMGAVYLAQRADGAFHMRVAVKLLPPGISTDAMRRRFADERQILARLAHPGIGRLLDGGVTAAGVPFLVMDYAAGVPIDVYCDDNLLDIDRRLALMLEVCDAVEYAHGHSVVHRDLKPNNILVSADGCMKLLDFGIAKVLDGAAAVESATTAFGASPMTAAYASPEQITGETVAFASDVYQLGVLLYLLLTGRFPSEGVGTGSWAERARATAVRRVVPASTAAGMSGQVVAGSAGPDARERARLRLTTVPALRSRLAGPMDAILLKALRHEPSRRYASVAALSREIRRHLAGNAVAASLEYAVPTRRLKRVEAGPVRVSAPAPAPPADPLERRIAVLPFDCPPGEGLHYLRHGLVGLFFTALDDSGWASVVEPAVVLQGFGEGAAPCSDIADARARSAQLGANLFVFGDVAGTGSSVRISAALHDVHGAGEARVVAAAEGSPDEVFELVDRVASEMLCAIVPAHAAEFARAAAQATTSLTVFKLFTRGERALQAGAFFAAADAYQRAVDADPQFAPGYYRLAMAAFWGHNLGLARRFAAEAAARSERLPARERRLLAALEQYLGGHATRAEQSYAAIIDESPGDLEAAFLAGTLLFFHNALRGRSQAEARPCFERVLAIQPDHILSLLYLSTIVARAGDLPTLDTLTERLLQAYPDGGVPAYPLVARAQRAFAGDGTLGQARILDELRHAGSLAAITAAQVVITPRTGLRGAVQVVDLLLAEPADGPAVQATGHILRAHLELARGRITAADRQLALAEALGSVEAREFRVLFALAPFLPAPAGALDALREAALGWDVADPPDAPPPIPHFAPHHGIHAALQLYLLGLINARLGAGDEALDQALRLEATALSSDDIALTSFAAAVRAEVALHRSGPLGALAVWEAHELGTSVERALSSSFYAHGHARFARAGALRAAGRDDDALAWFGTFGDLGMQDAVYLAPAYLHRAEICRDRGDTSQAVRCYRQFLDLWQDCDPVLQPVAESARQALARLADPQGDGPGNPLT
jgi:serine/threonine protein kinase/tetratricopeptide (TPR) repeat protein